MLLFTADVYPYVYIYMHPWKGKVAAWCCPLARLTCCIISQHLLKIDGVASLIAGLLGVFNQCWMSSSIIRIKDMWLGSINIPIERGKNRALQCDVPLPANRMPLPGVWHHWDGILLRCEVGSFATWKWKLPAAARCMVSTILLVEGQWSIYHVLSPGEQKIQDVTKSNHIHMVDFRTKKTAQLSSVHHKSFQKLKGNPSYPTNQPETNWTKIQQEKPSQLSWGPLRSRSLWLGAAAWGLEASHH